MKREDVQKWLRDSETHVRDPQPGDYFTDHLCPVAMVDKRDGDDVKVRKVETRDGERFWAEPRWMSLADFVKWLSYGDIPGVWVEWHAPKAEPSTVSEP